MEVAQVGVRTRARTLAMAAATAGTAKRRKIVGSGELQFSSSYLQLQSRRPLVATPDVPISPATSENSSPVTPADRCSSASSDHVLASRSSSNGSTELVKESLRSVDLEEEVFEIENSTYFDLREREMTPSSEHCAESDDLESTARPMDANSRHRSTVRKMPTDAEIDEFFSAAEKLEQKRFADKYNYDIVKDVPLEGRYEWIRIKP
uniref:Cyclin-dependent kinase inhibitor n=1 Tax=Nelumbo nucifera TaxID=4432 RepID=A0A822Z9G7_NELNU|nr:TPA_asm: hypothetical protein HUJ06_015553 [Nelumbo nucifera]